MNYNIIKINIVIYKNKFCILIVLWIIKNKYINKLINFF